MCAPHASNSYGHSLLLLAEELELGLVNLVMRYVCLPTVSKIQPRRKSPGRYVTVAFSARGSAAPEGSV